MIYTHRYVYIRTYVFVDGKLVVMYRRQSTASLELCALNFSMYLLGLVQI